MCPRPIASISLWRLIFPLPRTQRHSVPVSDCRAAMCPTAPSACLPSEFSSARYESNCGIAKKHAFNKLQRNIHTAGLWSRRGAAAVTVTCEAAIREACVVLSTKNVAQCRCRKQSGARKEHRRPCNTNATHACRGALTQLLLRDLLRCQRFMRRDTRMRKAVSEAHFKCKTNECGELTCFRNAARAWALI
jgi:hypothetical protein